MHYQKKMNPIRKLEREILKKQDFINKKDKEFIDRLLEKTKDLKNYEEYINSARFSSIRKQKMKKLVTNLVYQYYGDGVVCSLQKYKLL